MPIALPNFHRMNEPTFRELIRSIVARADFSTIAAFEPEENLAQLCTRYRVVPVFGIRLIFTRPRIPHLRLLEWLDGRPFPARAKANS
jgi:hypothetical protein